MLRSLAIVALALTCGACIYPLYSVSSVGSIPAPHDPEFILTALRKHESVRSAGVNEFGGIWAELELPAAVLEASRRPDPYAPKFVGIYSQTGRGGEPKILVQMMWRGYRESPEYRRGVQVVLDDLRDWLVERCGGH